MRCGSSRSGTTVGHGRQAIPMREVSSTAEIQSDCSTGMENRIATVRLGIGN